MMRCYKPGCRRAGSECYIAFEPYSTVKLCKRHYEEITLINTLIQADRFVWYQWMTGKTPELVKQ
jgi:hypothetical protein